MVVAVVLGCLPWILLRTDGINADGKSDFHWRWTKTPEEWLLAQAPEELEPVAPAPDSAVDGRSHRLQAAAGDSRRRARQAPEAP